MFYSETLLSKTGPLARVWLSANLERKLRKPEILQANIESSVNTILDQGQAPLALRLSGQLLLGVVRIYSRKANFLFDDCNEAIIKIRMAFRSGNVDLPQQAHNTNAASLILPDVITELDLLAPLPDSTLLFDDEMEEERIGPDPTRLGFGGYGSSQTLPSSYDRLRRASTEPSALLDDLDLDLDTGNAMSDLLSPEIEAGRDAPAPRRLSEEMREPSTLLDDGIELDLDFGESLLNKRPQIESTFKPVETNLDDMIMAGMEDEPISPQIVPDLVDDLEIDRRSNERSLSPLSSIRSSVERELDSTVNAAEMEQLQQQQDDETIHVQQRAKRRKVLQSDAQTEMPTAELRALQNDRSKILQPTVYLPKDPVLLALMQMQREGNFVSSILGNGRRMGLAPELRGILSLEVVRRSAELKRKRARGALPTPSPEPEVEEIRIPEAEHEAEAQENVLNAEAAQEQENENERTFILNEEAEEQENDDQEGYEATRENFDDTVAPILHPADSGPISLATKHAVHLLRDRFGPDAASTSTPSKRTKATVTFQDMLPEKTTTRADATKMFFEVLVLATKDAIKVEQETGALGAPLRVRGKRGLWGAWAEERVGGVASAGVEEVVTVV